MIAIRKIDHVAVCVSDIDGALAQFQNVLGLKAGDRGVSEAMGTEAVLLPIGDANIELIAPAGNDGLSRFLEKRGPGLHHVALEVEGLDAALAFLKSIGIPLLDDVPKIGARGHRVAFLHPRAMGGVLVELIEPAPHEAA